MGKKQQKKKSRVRDSRKTALAVVLWSLFGTVILCIMGICYLQMVSADKAKQKERERTEFLQDSVDAEKIYNEILKINGDKAIYKNFSKKCHDMNQDYLTVIGCDADGVLVFEASSKDKIFKYQDDANNAIARAGFTLKSQNREKNNNEDLYSSYISSGSNKTHDVSSHLYDSANYKLFNPKYPQTESSMYIIQSVHVGWSFGAPLPGFEFNQ